MKTFAASLALVLTLVGVAPAFACSDRRPVRCTSSTSITGITRTTCS